MPADAIKTILRLLRDAESAVGEAISNEDYVAVRRHADVEAAEERLDLPEGLDTDFFREPDAESVTPLETCW